MKSTAKFLKTFILINVFVFGLINFSKAQTDGTLTFTFTESTSTATKNVMAVWVEDNAGNFIKTQMRFWGNGTKDHLPTWVSKSGQNTVDAITGPTLTATTNPTAFGVKTVTWNGKDVTGLTATDGTFKIIVETSWKNPEPNQNQHSDIISFTFEKGTAETHITPTGDASFSDITIDWVPSANTTNIKTVNKNISIYPNPTNGILNLNFDKSFNVSRIIVANIYGEIVYNEFIRKEISDKKELNLQKLPAGVYFVEVLTENAKDNFKSKIVINK